MKKQIALLATIIAASGFTAFGQDWVTFETSGNGIVWDEFTSPGVGVEAGAGDLDVTILWATTGTSDPLSSVGTAGNMGLGSGPAVQQVATNGVTSVGNGIGTITSMLSSGWSLAQNLASGSGSAATGAAITTSGGVQGGKGGQVVSYNNSDPFEISATSTGATGSSIEMVMIAWNAASGSSYLTATALGWSNPFNNEIGSTAVDQNATKLQTSEGMNQFGVASVPEPTTLALAGLGGLSMLFLRRRKA